MNNENLGVPKTAAQRGDRKTIRADGCYGLGRVCVPPFLGQQPPLIEGKTVVLFKPVRLAASARDSIRRGSWVRCTVCAMLGRIGF
jgi:hypothetical protein